jgi:hypothetical protein
MVFGMASLPIPTPLLLRKKTFEKGWLPSIMWDGRRITSKMEAGME